MSNYCPHCGAQQQRTGAAFCATCGGTLRSSQINTLPGLTQPLLVVQEPGLAERSVPVTKSPFMIGRDPGQSDLTLNHPVVSRQHFQVEQRGSEFWLTDRLSSNGTMINGQRVQSQPLKDGDIIRIGDLWGNSVGLTFRRKSGSRPYASTIDLGQYDLARSPVLTIGRDPQNNIQLDHPLVSRFHARIERNGSAVVVRDLNSSNGTFINRQPVRGAHPLQTHDEVMIGPYKLIYNQGRLASYSPDNYRLDGIDLTRIVTLGTFWQKLRTPQNRLSQKTILNRVNVSIYPKEFVALVGGSGAGKSTLMKALSGVTPAKGQVLVNGDDLYANFAAYRHILGYVPQDDIIHQNLTVSNALKYAAQLRLPDATAPEIQQRITKVLGDVEMAEHEQKVVKDLSGGQRKRVSIAAELLAEPGLFFLDEPTSGLDPGLEKKMMKTMRALADDGRTIVMVTHATTNIDQCNYVAFMADGHLAYFGPPHEALTFFHATDFSDIYSRLTQPLDPVKNPLPQPHQQQLQVANAQLPAKGSEAWAAIFQQSADYQKYVGSRLQAVGSKPQSAQHQMQAPSKGFFAKTKRAVAQFGVLTRRYFELIWRDAFSLFILLAVMPLIGLLLLIMADRYDLVGLSQNDIRQQVQQEIEDKKDNEDRSNDDEEFQATYEVAGQAQKLLFMMALAANLLGIFAASFEIIKEEAIYRRERMVNLKILPYLFSKISVLAGFAVLQSLLFLLVVWLKVSYPAWGVFLPAVLEMYITLVLAVLASISLGLLISAAVRSSGTVIYVILLILFIQIIFAGAIFELPTLAQPISYLTTSRWTLEALGSTVDMERLNNKGITCIEFESEQKRQMQEQQDNDSEICESHQMAQEIDYEFNVNYPHTLSALLGRWLVLGGFSVIFGLLTVVAQKRKDVV